MDKSLRGGYIRGASYIFFNICIYVCAIGIYARLSDYPMFFPVSCIFSCVIPLITYMLFKKRLRGSLDIIAQHLLIFSSALTILIFSVFGPTFIDRSISYHLAFIAVEQGELNKSKLDQTGYTLEVFNKRYEDALVSGFIKKTNKGDAYIPTVKAKIMYKILMPLGKITGSLSEYDSLKEAINNEMGTDD